MKEKQINKEIAVEVSLKKDSISFYLISFYSVLFYSTQLNSNKFKEISFSSIQFKSTLFCYVPVMSLSSNDMLASISKAGMV